MNLRKRFKEFFKVTESKSSTLFTDKTNSNQSITDSLPQAFSEDKIISLQDFVRSRQLFAAENEKDFSYTCLNLRGFGFGRR